LSDKYKKQEKTPGILARLRKVAGLNIGTIMFGILFIYMSFSAILYFTTTHIESYQHQDHCPAMKRIQDLLFVRKRYVQRLLPGILPITRERAVKSMLPELFMV